MNEFLEQFLVEGRELIEQATRDLLELEQSPEDRERLDGVFRAFHTLKGAAGIVDFHAMHRALHAVEDTLAAIRAGDRAISADLITDCLSSLDQVSGWLRQIEATGELPHQADPEANRIVAKFTTAAEVETHVVVDHGEAARAQELINAQLLLIDQETEGEAGRIVSALRVAGNVMARLGHADAARRFKEALRGRPLVTDAKALLQGALSDLTAGANEGGGSATREEGAARTLRIDVARVDALVKLAGELTTAKNAIGHVADLARGGADAASLADLLRENYASMDRLVNELQRTVLNVRVLPMGQVFQRFPRLVREMSNAAGKPSRLITEGEDTEADKAIVEALFEPLLHVVRNALDHGIEAPEIREARGKPAVAVIVLRALRSGEHVVVEVEDDGGGIDVARVRQVAIERGAASRESVEAMDEEEAANLIFRPGFSTAATVTALSGRGVGMDAVRTAIVGMGGMVEVDNRPGAGAVVRFLLPFTLMMTRVMTVYAGGQAFGIPFDAVVETVRTPRDHVSSIGAARAFVYRDQTTPVIDLARTLGAAGERNAAGDATLVVTSVAGELSAFEVDQVGTSLDVMLSPMDGLLSGVRGIAGATVLGDGKVLIVLDLHELAE